MKKILSGVLAVTLVITSVMSSGIIASAQTGNQAPLAPSALKTELLEHPYGLDTKNPSFSWVVNDLDQNEVQTAYRIVLSNTMADVENQTYLLDTGWKESNENTYVKVEGLEEVLSDNDLCYWQVQTKDKDGAQSPLSEPQAFTTGVGSEWASKTSIWASTNSNDPFAAWTDYALEADLNVKENALGVVFRSVDGTHNYMMQFKASENQLNPHVMNGSWAQVVSIDLSTKGVQLSPNTPFKVKIEAIGNHVKTYIDTTMTGSDYKLVDERDFTQGFNKGAIGFRTGNSETGTVDNIQVTKLNSDGSSAGVLYSENFSSGMNQYPGCSIQNGALNVPKGQGNGSILSFGQEKGNFVFLRDEFQVDNYDAVEKAVLSVTAKSPEKTRQYVYNMYMNGEFVGLGPARFGTNTLYYNTYDVTDLLQEGSNALGAINYTQDEKAFLCQLTLFYKDGSSEVVVNSGRDKEEWTSLDGTNIFGDDGTNIGTGYFFAAAENINANLFPYGWDEPGFDDTSWNSVVDRGAIVGSYSLTPYSADNVQRYLVDAAVVEKKGDGVYWIDLGKEIVGGLHLDVDSPVAQQITVYSAEEGNREAGTVQWQMNTGNKYREYWTLKEGQQTIENIGMKTFRYVRIENCPVELTTENVKGLAMHQEFSEDESSFTSSNEMLNEIYDVMKYTIKATNQDLMVDSQSRERGAYEGDVLINMLSSYSFEDDYTLSRFSFEYLNTHRTWPVEYVFYSVIMSWLDYQYTGNIDSLQEYYDVLKGKLYPEQWVEDKNLFQVKHTNVNNWDSVLVDWPVSEHDGYAFSQSWYNTIMNAVAYGAYVDMAKIAGALGQTEDQQGYQNKADALKRGMIDQLYNPEIGAFRDGLTKDGQPVDHYAQHSTAFALAYGVYDSQEMADKMAAYVGKDDAIKTSVYGSFFVLSGLYNANAGDIATKLMTDTNGESGARTWAYMIRTLGATITTEAWNETNKPNMTYSHPWGSAPGSQITRGMFGIQPIDPGFDTFQIKFQPGDVENASIKVPSIKGSIEASYAQNTGANFIESTVSIPVNTKAQVSLPAKESGHDYLIVDGKSVQADRSNGYLTVELGSGVHTVALPIAVKLSASIESENNMMAGTTGKLNISAVDANGAPVSLHNTTISYESSDESVAAVAADGTVSFLKGGDATLTAKVTFPSLEVAGKTIQNITLSTSCKALVAEVSGVTVSPDKLSLEPGRTQQFTATVQGLNADSSVSWTVSGNNSKNTAITPDGVLTIGEDETAGELTVTAASIQDPSKTGSVTIPVTPLYGTALEEMGYVTARQGASMVWDETRGWLLDLTSGWIAGGNSPQDGGGAITNAAELFKKSDFTVSMDVNFTEQHDNTSILLIGNSDNFLRILPQATNGKGYLKFKANGGAEQQVELAKPLELNKWQTLKLVYHETDGIGSVSVYIDGELVLENQAVGFALSALDTVDASLGCTYATGFMRIGKYDNIVVMQPTDTDKTILNKVIEKAEALLGSDEYNNAISSVQKSFLAALEAAREVAVSNYATAEEVQAAWVSLMTEIHKLGLQQGDKALLQEHYDLYSQLDLDLYLDNDAKENFKAALEAAEAMLANDDAVQSEVDAVDNALVAAAQALVKRGDKTALQSVVDSTAGYVKDHYAKGWAEFEAARDAANAVLADDNASQEQIDEATDNLIAAMLELRLKADKNLLNSVIAAAETIDLSGYSAESVNRFNAALAAAKAASVNDSLTAKDDQAMVDELADNLKKAIEGLENADGTSANLSIEGDGRLTGATGSAKTGDTTPIAAAAALILLAGAGFAVRKRSK